MKSFFSHFDLLAPVYEKVIHPQIQNEFWELVDIPNEGRILDAGGGTGRVSKQINKSGCQIVVTDLSIPMLREAGCLTTLNTVSSQTEVLPFPDGVFDRIIMVDAFHHVLDQKKTAEELWRVLKPGGHLVIEEPDINQFAVKLLAIGEKLAFMRSHFFTGPRILDLFPFEGTNKSLHIFNHTIWVVIKKI